MFSFLKSFSHVYNGVLYRQCIQLSMPCCKVFVLQYTVQFIVIINLNSCELLFVSNKTAVKKIHFGCKYLITWESVHAPQYCTGHVWVTMHDKRTINGKHTLGKSTKRLEQDCASFKTQAATTTTTIMMMVMIFWYYHYYY